MKCKKCGEEIKTGNLYCSKCGAEVQIVSAYNVMEEEFFLDFQNEQMSAKQQDRSLGGEPVLQKKNLYAACLVAIIGFLLLVALAFAVKMNADRIQKTSLQDEQVQLVQLLADADDRGAKSYLKQKISRTDGDLADRFWLAWLCGRQNDHDGQTTSLQQILEMDPENVYACRELIHVYVEANDFEGLYRFYDACAGSRLTALFEDYLVEAPEILIPAEAVRAGDTLSIRAAEGLNVYYTLDGTSPVTNGMLYYAPIKLSTGTFQIRAVACNEEGYYSNVVSAELTVQRRYQLGMPAVTPNSGEYLSPQTIYVNVPEGCSAYYTWNGSNPTTASKKYNGGISMPEGNNVLSVILVDEYGNMSSVQRVNYIYMP